MSISNEEDLTLPQIFLHRAAQYQSKDALYHRGPQGTYLAVSWSQWAEKVKAVSTALYRLGLRRGDRAAIFSENRPEWTYADLGALCLGAVSVPIYPTSSLQDASYILENSQSKILFVSNQEQLDRIKTQLETNQNLLAIIAFDSVTGKHPKLHTLEQLLAENRGGSGFSFENSVKEGKPEDLATLIYTSGTTGPPKGVMLTHHNFVANYVGAGKRITITEKDSALSFLPLSHVFERLAGYYFMAFHGASIAYAQNMQTVPQDIIEIRPTVCAAVPRFYEKVYGKILEKVNAGSPLKKKIFCWAIKTGKKRTDAFMQKKPLSLPNKIAYAIAKTLVFNQIKNKMGGRIRFFISGGAPLAKELAEFFFAADILILEGYGLTETSPVIAVNTPEEIRFGTVGKPLPNAEVRIAEDGEILTRGPAVMKGYFKNPEATAEVMKDGWFHTGDIGTLEDGFLKITDRKKDIIATSGGKKVSPQNIEGKIIADSLFSQAVIVGDKKNYLVALVVPSQAQVIEYARRENISFENYENLLNNPRIKQWIDGRFRRCNEGMASYEQIKYFTLLPKEFTLEAGEITPTLKYKRRFIMEKYKDLIDEMYRPKAEV